MRSLEAPPPVASLCSKTWDCDSQKEDASSSLLTSHPAVVQRQETSDLKSLQDGFESHAPDQFNIHIEIISDLSFNLK